MMRGNIWLAHLVRVEKEDLFTLKDADGVGLPRNQKKPSNSLHRYGIISPGAIKPQKQDLVVIIIFKLVNYLHVKYITVFEIFLADFS